MIIVGYGDVYFKFFFGKIIGMVCVCVGVLIVVFFVLVIGSNFMLFYFYV